MALGHLREEVVFVGGATVSLYADRAAEDPRETMDVDVLLEIWTLKDLAAVEEQLRAMGFVNDQASGIMVRFKYGPLIVDVMPTGREVLGFGNQWYPDGYKSAVNYKIDGQHTVKIFSAPYFIASKIEAFRSPGREHNNDGLASRDFEDIVYVLENRLAVWDELVAAPEPLKAYLQDEVNKLLRHPRFEEWLSYAVGFGSPPANYYILEQLKRFLTR